MIVRTVLYCVVYRTVVHSDMHAREQFLNLRIYLGLGSVLVPSLL